LFVRECVGHAVSVWQQHVKGWQGETAPLDDWLAHKYDRPIQLARLVQALSATDGIELQVSNYDHHKRQLIPVVERWLNLSPGVLQSGPRERLNRSLTAAEAALQRALNTHLGPCGKVFAFRLVNRLPDVPDDPPLPSLGAQDAARARLGSALEIVNSYLAPGEQLAFSFQRPPQTSNALLLTLEQLETIAEGIAHAVDRKVLKVSSQAQLPSLPRRIARRLRKMVRLPRGAAASAPIAIK
jgi:hypothetical protein